MDDAAAAAPTDAPTAVPNTTTPATILMVTVADDEAVPVESFVFFIDNDDHPAVARTARTATAASDTPVFTPMPSPPPPSRAADPKKAAKHRKPASVKQWAVSGIHQVLCRAMGRCSGTALRPDRLLQSVVSPLTHTSTEGREADDAPTPPRHPPQLTLLVRQRGDGAIISSMTVVIVVFVPAFGRSLISATTLPSILVMLHRLVLCSGKSIVGVSPPGPYLSLHAANQ